MGLSRRQFTKELIAEVARALEISPNVLHRSQREFRQGPGNVFPGNGKQRWSEGRVAELERKIDQQALEIDLLKRCLQHIEEQRMRQALTGNPPSTGNPRRNESGPGIDDRTQDAVGPGSAGPAFTSSPRPTSLGPIQTWICATPSSASLWNGPATAGRGSPPNCVGKVGG
jgi:transposase